MRPFLPSLTHTYASSLTHKHGLKCHNATQVPTIHTYGHVCMVTSCRFDPWSSYVFVPLMPSTTCMCMRHDGAPARRHNAKDARQRSASSHDRPRAAPQSPSPTVCCPRLCRRDVTWITYVSSKRARRAEGRQHSICMRELIAPHEWSAGRQESK